MPKPDPSAADPSRDAPADACEPCSASALGGAADCVPGGARHGARGANLSGLRDHNAAAVLRLVRTAGGEGVSRVELAQASGLTAQAISKIVARLTDDGLLAEVGRRPSTGGKPRTLLRLVADARVAVGVQLGREELRVLLVDLTGRTVAVRTAPSSLDRAPSAVLDQLAAEVDAVLEASGAGGAGGVGGAGGAARAAGESGDAGAVRERVLGVGVACPGPLDSRAGVLHGVTGLPGAAWRDYPLAEQAAARLGLPVLLEKDSTAGVLSQLGPADRAFVYLDAGVGAGMVLGGRVHRGARTNAGEFGHQCVDPAGPRCGCGRTGCLEAVCREALRAGRPERAADALGTGVAGLVRLLDLEQIVLGGREALAAPALYLDALTRQLAAWLPDPEWQRVEVVLARAGADAVARGAAGLVLERLFTP